MRTVLRRLYAEAGSTGAGGLAFPPELVQQEVDYQLARLGALGSPTATSLRSLMQ